MTYFEVMNKVALPVSGEDLNRLEKLVERGGEGSGHHGHRGRPGKKGGSLPSGAQVAQWQKTAESNFAHRELDPLNLKTAGFFIAPSGRVYGKYGEGLLFGAHYGLAEEALKGIADEVQASIPARPEDYGEYDKLETIGHGLGYIAGYVTRSNELNLSINKIPTAKQMRIIKDIYVGNKVKNFIWDIYLDPEEVGEFAPVYTSSGDVDDFRETIQIHRAIYRGGPGSGHHGHKGRPGEVGGSLPSGKKKSTASLARELRDAKENNLLEFPPRFTEFMSVGMSEHAGRPIEFNHGTIGYHDGKDVFGFTAKDEAGNELIAKMGFGEIDGREHIWLTYIRANNKGTGLGTAYMESMREVSDAIGLPFRIMFVTNPDFYERFDWFGRVPWKHNVNRDPKYRHFIYEPS